MATTLPGAAVAAPAVRDETDDQRRQRLRIVVAASLLGTTVEWYDFFLYATAAGLVFNKVFFPDASSLVGTLLAFATFAVGFVMRPVGGLVFGMLGRVPSPGDSVETDGVRLIVERVDGRRVVRLRLVRLLATEPSGVTHLVASTGMSQPLVSQHLRTLRSAGIVTVARAGREALYSISDDHIAHVVDDALTHVLEEDPTDRGEER